MKLDQYLGNTDFLKFAAESYIGAGGNPIELFTESAEWLYDCYKKTGDEVCLKAAVQLIKAYVELGFLCKDSETVFGEILDKAGMSLEKGFQKQRYNTNVIKRKKLAVREVLGYWPQISDRITNVDAVVNDIMKKIEAKNYGCFYYGRHKDEIDFELLILEEDVYLLDLNKKKVYVFEKTEGKD